MLQEYLNLKKRYKSYNTALTNAGIKIKKHIPMESKDQSGLTGGNTTISTLITQSEIFSD